MARAALLRRSPTPRIARRPFEGPEHGPRQDPRGPGPHSTLDYRTSMELLRCIEILGEDSAAECRHEILGEPYPEFRDVAGITSPVPFFSAVQPDGSARTRIGSIAVTIEPDRTSTDPAMQNRAETTFNTSITSPSASTLNGRVTTVNLGDPIASITIRTVYGPGTSAATASGYGRGTTQEDIASGSTSLGFHESRHGVDFLRYMANVPQPELAAPRGITTAQFLARRTAYMAAWNSYFTEMEHRSVHHTDCVGSTSAASAQVQAICTHTHTPVPNP